MLKDFDPREGGFGVPILALLVGTALVALLLWLAPGHSPHSDASGTSVGSATHHATEKEP